MITWTISFGLDKDLAKILTISFGLGKDLANFVKDLGQARGSGQGIWANLASGQGIWAKPPLDKDLGQATSGQGSGSSHKDLDKPKKNF